MSRARHRHRTRPAARRLAVVLAALLVACLWASGASSADRLPEFLATVDPGAVVPGADRFGEPAGSPPVAPALRGDDVAGFVFLNSDFVDSTGYSGKPIHIVAGIDPAGQITGLAMVEHQEPIVLIGIPEARVIEAMDSLIGVDVAAVAAGRAPLPQVDLLSGATVTVLVMGDSVLRAAIAVVRGGRLADARAGSETAAPAARRTVAAGPGEVRDWEALVGDGSVRRLSLSLGDVNEAFGQIGDPEAAARPERGDPDETFIDLYAALATIPTVGRSLLGDADYERMLQRLGPGQHAIVVMGEGRYSFKGSGYVRGGIFDRIELVQDLNALRFRDRDHTRLGDVAAAGAPDFDEVSLFRIPSDFPFDPTGSWTLQLLVQRATGPLDKAFTTFGLRYIPPERYIETAAPAETAGGDAPGGLTAAPTVPGREGEAEALTGELAEPLWVRIWRANTVNIGIAVLAIGVLTAIFFFQDFLVKRYTLYLWVRRGFLAFTLVWIGWWANAQLSVVNVITFTNALMTEFSWTYFLTAPLIFIFWFSVAAGLLFWGRGPFCGWLCPFGALQELTNNAARALKVPQINVPWGVNERLWPIKYIIFLVLFGLSLYSVAMAEIAAEVEPFKTAITLKFMRAWPFVLYAVLLLVIGLFIERFFCRYLCPLGAALAIPTRLSMFFGWLKRHPQCGSPCQRCAKECPVQCIHPDGQINPNECIWCMHCQDLYWDEHRCPAMIQKRLRREKLAASTPPNLGDGRMPLAGRREHERDHVDAKKTQHPHEGVSDAK